MVHTKRRTDEMEIVDGDSRSGSTPEHPANTMKMIAPRLSIGGLLDQGSFVRLSY
jgi:hypothetical protein